MKENEKPNQAPRQHILGNSSETTIAVDESNHQDILHHVHNVCVCSVVPYPLCAILVFDDVPETTVFSVAPVVSGVRRDPNQSVDMFRQLVEQNL